MTAAFIAVAAVVVILLFLLSASIRIAREYERGVVFMLGPAANSLCGSVVFVDGDGTVDEPGERTPRDRILVLASLFGLLAFYAPVGAVLDRQPPGLHGVRRPLFRVRRPPACPGRVRAGRGDPALRARRRHRGRATGCRSGSPIRLRAPTTSLPAARPSAPPTIVRRACGNPRRA